MKINGLKILVTGGAGFIGSHIVESLVKGGAQVTVFDNFSFGQRQNLAEVIDDIRIIEGDILDYKQLFQAMKGHQAVSHQAAQLEIFLASADPNADLRTNTIGTLHVLQAAHQTGVAKVINASSACVYGQKEGLTSEQDLPIPNWEYGVSKLAAERYATIYSQYHHLPVISLRYGITYGPKEWYRRVLTIFIKRSIEGQGLVIFGDGRQIRDFIDVSDVVAIHNLAIEDDRCPGDYFNVGSGIGTSINQLAEVVKTVSGQDLKIIHEDVRQGQFSKLVPQKKRNVAELKSMMLDCTKAQQMFGWQPKVTLEEGVRREYEWAKANPKYWQTIHYSA